MQSLASRASQKSQTWALLQDPAIPELPGCGGKQEVCKTNATLDTKSKTVSVFSVHTQTVALWHRGTPHPDLMRVLLHQCLPWNVNPVMHSLRIWSNGPNGPTQRRRIRWLLNHCGRCHRRFCRGKQRSTPLGDSANGFGRRRLSPFAACLQTWWLRDAPGMVREKLSWFLWSKVDLAHPSLFCLFCLDLLSLQLSIISNWSSLYSLFSFSCVDSGLHPDCSGTSQHSVFFPS